MENEHNMIKHFYSYIIETDSLIAELDEMDLTEAQRSHLEALIDSSLHHTVIDAILSELSEEDKKVFLRHMHTKQYEKLWKHLHTKVEDIETKIQKAANELKKELHKDIREVKGK
jgi:DNA-directed RNA polymerase specialized sigma24 family protein